MSVGMNDLRKLTEWRTFMKPLKEMTKEKCLEDVFFDLYQGGKHE